MAENNFYFFIYAKKFPGCKEGGGVGDSTVCYFGCNTLKTVKAIDQPSANTTREDYELYTLDCIDPVLELKCCPPPLISLEQVAWLHIALLKKVYKTFHVICPE